MEATAAPGHLARTLIPIQNVYYLFCYAWNRFREGQAIDVSRVESPELSDLFATVLISGTKRLLRRGFDRGYVTHREDTGRLRGKIDISETVKRFLTLSARAHCVFDELDYDVLHNRILRTTIERLARVENIDVENRRELLTLSKHLEPVEIIRVTRQDFRRVQLHSNNASYGLLMKICELVHEAVLPEGTGGLSRFADILKDEVIMSAVFQDFVRNFYRLEQTGFSVSGEERLHWDAIAGSDEAGALLPVMRPDIWLRSSDRRILLDTKYYRETLQESEYRQTLHSGHLYQLFAYMKNAQTQEPGGPAFEGVLLYPKTRRAVDVRYQVQGHKVRIYTLDLAQDWRDIRRNLIDLVVESPLVATS
jgi:5-methylcytosine-specific restriction enzyme subunit McrC